MNASGAVSFLVTTLIDLYVMAVLLRLLLQWVRADFYNPICQFLVRITNPPLIPMRRVIPSIGRLDTASVVLMVVLQLVEAGLLSLITPEMQLLLTWPFVFVYVVRKLLVSLLMMYLVLIIAAVILSWVGARARHPIVPLIYQLTEPVLRPFRKLIPPIGGIDLSPLFALIAIQFLLLLMG
ncbi:MAG: YggT family protein [Xanthomonadales bacterium]|nr:YggT family protein [Xanthomonadales bacterium]NIX12241.1 YggT family protein [Xanthomonadales bacterium]